MAAVRVRVEGTGVLGTALLDRAAAHAGCEVVPSGDADVVVLAVPGAGDASRWSVPTIAPVLRQGDVASAADLTIAGFWGGLGSLLAAVAVEEAQAPRAVHVAYGFPGARRLVARCSPSVRRGLLDVATDRAVARIDGQEVDEPLGEGRRLAWFPQPVGPAHAVAVGGLEHLALPDVPTVRTWVAARSLAAEALQAVGRLDPARGTGAWLAGRAAGGGGGPGATADVRWAVVVECLDEDGGIIRAWANGTDPVVAAADLLLVAAQRLVAAGTPPDGTVVGLGDVHGQLDAVADLRTLRWSVSRPEPSAR